MLIKPALALFLFILPAFSPMSYAFTVVALKSKDLPPYDQAISGFLSELADGNVDFRVIEDVAGKSSEVHSRIVADKPGVILCLGTEALETACSIEDVSKVFCLVPLYKAQSLIAQSGRKNINGVVMDLPVSDQFRILMEIFPKLRRIGVMYDPELSRGIIAKADEDAKSLKLELIARPVHSIKDVPSALDHLKDKVDILWSIFDSTAYGPETSKYALLHTLKKNIPFIGFSPQFAKAGALIALYGDFKDMGKQSALITRQIMNKEKMSVEIVRPRQTCIAVNRKVAEALKVNFPPQFLKDVNEIY